MKHSIRWMHLSDFHVGKDGYAQRNLFKSITDFVKIKKEEGWIPDFLFLTGDLANTGSESEYKTFIDDFLWPIQEIIGSDIEKRTFAVPGNHDVNRNLYQAFDREEIASSKEKYFDADTNGCARRQIIFPRFQAYIDNDLTASTNWIEADNGSYSVIEEIKGINVGIVGINSAWLCKNGQDPGNLVVGVPLLENALCAIQECDLRIVLGHHPLEWLRPTESRQVRSILGKNLSLYLHGHLHDAWSEPTYGGGHEFLTIQTGAAFQEREDEKWRNGFLLGEVNWEEKKLSLQPRKWNSIYRNWTLDGDAFPENHKDGDWWKYDLPRTDARRSKIADVPKGWSVITLDMLRKCVLRMDATTAVKFFNGAVPDWSMALSSVTPRREIVNSVTGFLNESLSADMPNIGFILGAGCEGKTTVLLQSAFHFLENNPEWKLLYRQDETREIRSEKILPLLESEHKWLIVIDEVDNISSELFLLLQQANSLDVCINVLTACRESDWHSSRSDKHAWSNTGKVRKFRLEGIDKNDADAIITCWAEYGADGLGRLNNIANNERAERLLNAAHEEAKVSKGAFFGALLTVRFGDDLRQHAELMLDRLAERPVTHEKSLRDALKYVAAMHAEQLDFLSRPVLARVLGCNKHDVQTKVLRALSAEAATTTTSQFIFTRHLQIAKSIMTVITTDIGESAEMIYEELAVAAAQCFGQEFIPSLPEWRHKFPEHFLDTGRPEWAISIAQALYDQDKNDWRSLVKLAHIFRKADTPHLAVRLFREFPSEITVERGFFLEWGIAEGQIGNINTNVLLAAFSLSDQSTYKELTYVDVGKGLATIATLLHNLHEKFRKPEFILGQIAAAALGININFDNDFFYEYVINPANIRVGSDFKEEIKDLSNALDFDTEHVESEVVFDWIGGRVPFTFNGMRRLIINASMNKSN